MVFLSIQSLKKPVSYILPVRCKIQHSEPSLYVTFHQSDESARIDGASNTRVFFQIILPLSRPMLAVVAMNGFTGPLGDFILSSTILRSAEYYTLPIGLYNLVNQAQGASYTKFAAGAILISIPVALVFLLLQKNFVSGLTSGGTKG